MPYDAEQAVETEQDTGTVLMPVADIVFRDDLYPRIDTSAFNRLRKKALLARLR
jgi:hypothetical protein